MKNLIVKRIVSFLIVTVTVLTLSLTATFAADIIGDANGDGTVSMKDVLCIRKYLLGIIDDDEINYKAACVTSGDNLSMKDVLCIRKYLLGIIEKFPAEENAENAIPEECTAVFDLVNTARTENGKPALTYRTDLQEAADIRAQELVELFSHTRPNGSTCFTAIDEAGVDYACAGENVACGQKSAAAVMNAWMNSSGHKQNILDSDFTGIAVGHYVKNGVNYWVQIFIG